VCFIWFLFFSIDVLHEYLNLKLGQ